MLISTLSLLFPKDLFNLAPKKPNWDLKRDLEKKMDRLEKSTIIAIAQLIRLRLKAEGGIDAGVMDLKAVVDDDE